MPTEKKKKIIHKAPVLITTHGRKGRYPLPKAEKAIKFKSFESQMFSGPPTKPTGPKKPK